MIGRLNPGLSLFDLGLGVRMLVRYPVLTVVGTASLAFAIFIGASVFALISLILWPTLPRPAGGGVASVGLHDEAANEDEDRLTADFLRWRNATTSLTDFGAGRGFNRNLTLGDGRIEPTHGAAV